MGKLIWLGNQLFFYALRPMLKFPKKPEKWHLINWVFQITVMVVYTYLVGPEALYYLLLSLFFAGSLHPLSGHFVSEHYVVKEDQETYSYYGPLNKLTFNVGYHNEHHDFPYIPGSRLPELKKMAPEYYDNLYSHKSWVRVLYDFIVSPNLSLYNRVKRKGEEDESPACFES